MRVTRALEKLRDRLQRRGIVSTAAALAGVLGTQAVSAAPAGLAASVATAVSAGVVATATASPVLSLFSFMSLTKTSGTIIAVIALASVAVVSYRLGAASTQEASFPVTAAVTPAAARPRTPDAVPAPAAAAAITVPPFAPVATSEADQKITALRDMLTRLPEQYIPEIVFVTDGEWHQAVDGKLESPEDFRRAMSRVRAFAEAHFAKAVYPAILQYRKTHEGQFITDLAQLQPNLGPEVTPAMLQRYRLIPAATIPNVIMGGDTILSAPLIDSKYDTYLIIGPNGWGTTSSAASETARDFELLEPAFRAYRAAKGEDHSDLLSVLPYATTPEQRAMIEKLARQQAPNP